MHRCGSTHRFPRGVLPQGIDIAMIASGDHTLMHEAGT